jgi:SP family sugar porter-like MFS transporter
MNQFTIVIGILAAQAVNWLVADSVPPDATPEFILSSWNGQTGWRWMFGLTAVPGLAFFVSMFAIPESPRWLCAQGRYEDARKILSRIGGGAFADAELPEIRATVSSVRGGVKDLASPAVRPVLMLGIFIAVLQQWCGINVVFNYAQEVFAGAGYQVSDILLNIVITGVINMICTVVALFTVDRIGRRPLMLAGTAGLALIYLLLGLSYRIGVTGFPVLLLVALAVACFACTLGPVTWVVLSEMFPNRIRGAAMGVGVFALWAGCFVLTFTYPYLNRELGAAGTFWLYSAVCAAGFAVLRLKLPETKGLSLERIERDLSRHPPQVAATATSARS